MRELLPLSALVERVTEKNVGLIDRVFTVSAENGLVDQETYFNKRVASKNLAGYTVVRPGDFVYNKSYSTAAPLGMTTRNHHEEAGVVSPLYIVFRVASECVLERYLELAVLSHEFASSLEGFLKEGGRAHGAINVSLADFFSAVVPVPPLDEQRRIVDLIAAVDEAAESARRCSEASSDMYRTALVEGFRKVVESSPVRSLSEVSTARLGKMLNKAAKTGVDEYPYVRNADVQWDELRLDDLNTMFFSAGDRKEFALRAGDVLICEGGEVGRAAVVEEDLDGIFFQKAIHRVRCGPELLPRFLMHYMRFCAMTGGLADYATSLTIAHLTGEKLRTLTTPTPPVAEQEQLIGLLDSLLDHERRSEDALSSIAATRSALLADLLSGAHEIPASYDELLEDVA